MIRRLVVALLVIGLPLSALVWQAELIAARALETILGARGVEAVVRVNRVGLDHIHIGTVRLGSSLIAEGVEVAYAPRQLWRGRLGDVTVQGPRIRARATADGVDVPALQALTAGQNDSLDDLVWPLGELRIVDGEVLLETPLGPVVVVFDGTMHSGPEGNLVVDGNGVVHHEAAWASVRLEGTVARDGGASARLVLATADLATAEVSGRDMEGWVDLARSAAGDFSARVEVLAPRLVVMGNRLTQTTVRARHDADGSALRLITGTLGDSLRLDVRASADLGAADRPLSLSGSATFAAFKDLGALHFPTPASRLDGSATFEIKTSVNALTAAAIWPRARGDLILNLALTEPTPEIGRALVAGRLAVESSDGALRIAAGEGLHLSLAAAVPGWDTDAAVTVSLASGDAHLSVGPDGRLSMARLAATGTLALEGPGLPDLTGRFGGAAEIDPAEGRIRTARIRAHDVTAAPWDVAGRRITLRAFNADLKGNGRAMEGTMGLALHHDGPLGPLTAAEGTIAMNAKVGATIDGEGYVRPEDCLELSIGAAAWPGVGRLSAPAELCLQGGGDGLASLRRSGDGIGVAWDLRLAPAALELALDDGGKAAVTLPRLAATGTAGPGENRRTVDIQASGGAWKGQRISATLSEFVLSATQEGKRTTGTFAAAVEGDGEIAEGPRIAGMRAALSAALASDGQAVWIVPDDCLSISVEVLESTAISLPEGFSTCLRPANVNLLRLDLETADGPTASVDAMADAAAIELHVTRPDREPWILEGQTPSLRVGGRYAAGSGSWTGTVETDGGRLTVPAAALEVSGMTLATAVSGRGGAMEGDVVIKALALSDRAEPTRFAPLSATGTARLANNAAAFTVTVADQEDRVSIDLEGRHDLAEGEGRVAFALRPVNFAPGSVQPQGLLPLLRGQLSEVRGHLTADGSATWGTDELVSALTVVLREGAAQTRVAALDGVDAEVRFTRLAPPATGPDQRLSVALLDVGLPMENLDVRFQVLPEGVISVSEALWPWAGGKVTARDIRLDPSADSHHIVLHVEGVDVADMLEILDVEGLTGTGRLSGRIPVEVVGGDPAIRRARLQSAPPGGTLRYTGKAGAAALRSNVAAALVADALEDFHYSSMVMELDGVTTGPIDVRLHLAGANPALYDGHPIALNVNLQGDVGQILRGATFGVQIPETIRERLGDGHR